MRRRFPPLRSLIFLCVAKASAALRAVACASGTRGRRPASRPMDRTLSIEEDRSVQKGPFSLGSRTPRLELARRAAELERASAGSAAREQFIGPKFQSSRRAFSSGGSGARLAGRGGGDRCIRRNAKPSMTNWVMTSALLGRTG